MKKKSIFYLVKYELLNNIYNGYSFFFGALFPLILLFLISTAIKSDVPKEVQPTVITTLFLTMSMIVPLATMFLGYAATYANELEKDVPLRLNMYGISQNKLFMSKLIANYIFFTVCFLFYLIAVIFLELEKPTLMGAVTWVLVIYVFASFILALAHGLANIFKSFGKTYGIVMGIYFGIMILSGMMGIKVTDLPEFIQPFSKLLPTTQIGLDYIDFWMGKSYNFAPLIQSMIFFGAVCIIVLLLSYHITGRKNK